MSLLPGQLNSDNTPTGQAPGNSSPECWPCRNTGLLSDPKGIFLIFTMEIQLLGLDLTIIGGALLRLLHPQFLTLRVVHSQLSVIHHSSGFLTQYWFLRQFLLVSSALVNFDRLYLPVSSAWGQQFGLRFPLSMDPRSFDFSVHSTFYCCQGRVLSSTLLTSGTRNWKSLLYWMLKIVSLFSSCSWQ